MVTQSFPRVRQRTWRMRVLQGLVGDWLTGVALLVLALVTGSALLAPLIVPHDPLYQDITQRFRPPAWLPNGSAAHLLGTDQLGRDVLSRVIFGGRVSLQIALLAVVISGAIGVSVGLVAGYVGGGVGDVLMRLADIQHSFPFIVLAIAIMSVLNLGRLELFGRLVPVDPFWALVGILSVWGWSGYARVARGGVLAVKEREFVQSARLLGAGHRRILVRHILPNVVSPLFVLWSFALASLIIAESSLSFLGFGVQAPTPSWGNMLADGRGSLATAWWVAVTPGVAIMVTVLAVNVIGDRLRDILDPRVQV